jgi:hypothetical protein
VPQWGHQAPPWQAFMTQGHRAQGIKLKKESRREIYVHRTVRKCVSIK